MIRRTILLLYILLIPIPSEAWIHGASNASGYAQLGIGDVVAPSYAFLDQMKSWAMTVASGSGGLPSGPGLVSSDGYPLNGTLAQDIPGSITNFISGGTGIAGTFQITATGTCGIKFPLVSNTQVTVNSNTGTTFQNGTFTVLSGASFVANITFAVPHSNLGVNFPATTNGSTPLTYSNCSNIQFCRSGNATPDDCTRLANGQIINPDFSNSLIALHPKTLRAMDWSGANIGTDNYPSKKGYNAALTSIGWVEGRWAGPNVWAGTITGDDVGADTYLSPTFTDAPASWPVNTSTLPVTWQAVFQTTNTTTTPTIVVAGISGAKTLVTTSDTALAVGAIKTDRPSTLIYDPLLLKELYAANPLAPVVPIEAQVALANAVGANLWYNFTGLVDDTSISSYVAYASANLNSGLGLYTEYSNECWNFSLGPMTTWAAARGAALGLPSGNNEQVYGWCGLRTWQVNNLAGAAWTGSGPLRRVIANQESAGTASSQQKWRLNGFDLVGATYPTYCAYVGGSYSGGVCTGDPLHNTYPNRPIDNSDVIAYATYYQGAVMTGPGSFGGTYADAELKDCSVAGTNSGGVICAGNNYILGTTASLNAAYAWLDNDIRQGTKNGVAPSNTLAAFACNSTGGCNANVNASGYIVWENIAASYDSDGRIVPLRVENYEGGLQTTWPTDTNCLAMTSTSFPSGIAGSFTGSADCATTIQNMLTGYRASSYASALVVSQFQQFMGSDPTAPTFGLLLHSKTPSWYQYQGPTSQVSPWPLLQNSIYSTPYDQLYSGFGSFVGLQNFLLKRDLDPASNDNDPMWLEKAA